MAYEPKHIQRWTMPPCYVGEVWPEFYSSGFGQHRDSDALARSNFQVAFVQISKATSLPEDQDEIHPQIVRENHWAVGWVEWIAIHQDDDGALKAADELRESYNGYPVLDEDHFYRVEDAEANEVWANCYDVSDRIKYIRKHRSQFEFHDFQDMLACVRGKYFAGYASELLH